MKLITLFLLILVVFSSQSSADHFDFMPSEWVCCNHRDCFEGLVFALDLAQHLFLVQGHEVWLASQNFARSPFKDRGVYCLMNPDETSELRFASENIRCVFYMPGFG